VIGSVDANIETFEHSYYGTVSGFRADEVIFERVSRILFGSHISSKNLAAIFGPVQSQLIAVLILDCIRWLWRHLSRKSLRS
jgi:hypothetical protein